ncbi:MAG: hypothetical protein WC292_01875 [Clostridia bacterium]
MLYSQLKGKKVVAIDTANYCGTVSGIYIQKDTYAATHLLLSDAENCILAYADIFGFGETLTIRSAEVLSPLDAVKDFTFFDIGLPVLDVDGNSLGTSKELDLHAKSREKRFTADEVINLKAIVASSPEAIVVNPRRKQLKPRPKQTQPAKETPPEFHKPYEEVQLATATFREPTVTEKINNDYSFLLGRRVEREITDITRTFVIKAGTVITDRIIDTAQKAGKLVDLTINSIKR